MREEFTVQPLEEAALEDLAAYWATAHPLHPLSPSLLRDRLFGPVGAAAAVAARFDRELRLAARDDAGRLVGVACGVYPVKESGVGGVRWLGVAEPWRGRGVEAALLDELTRRLAARGAREVRLFGTPPHYLRPGVDTRDTALIATLLDLGWTHTATSFNMTVDLRRWTPPAAGLIWDADSRGYQARRARSADRAAFGEYMARDWTPTWREEADQAFAMEPIPLFLAWKGGEIAGFAACEVSQCLGGFGPTGVTPAHQGAGLGKRLLWACLDHLRQAGRPVCEIGWIGPASFYWRACGATLGPAYWMMQRTLTGL